MGQHSHNNTLEVNVVWQQIKDEYSLKNSTIANTYEFKKKGKLLSDTKNSEPLYVSASQCLGKNRHQLLINQQKVLLNEKNLNDEVIGNEPNT